MTSRSFIGRKSRRPGSDCWGNAPFVLIEGKLRWLTLDYGKWVENFIDVYNSDFCTNFS